MELKDLQDLKDIYGQNKVTNVIQKNIEYAFVDKVLNCELTNYHKDSSNIAEV